VAVQSTKEGRTDARRNTFTPDGDEEGEELMEKRRHYGPLKKRVLAKNSREKGKLTRLVLGRARTKGFGSWSGRVRGEKLDNTSNKCMDRKVGEKNLKKNARSGVD